MYVGRVRTFAEDAIHQPPRAFLRRERIRQLIVSRARRQVEALVQFIAARERAADEVTRQPKDSRALLCLHLAGAAQILVDVRAKFRIGEEAGAALAAHPDIDRLSFTGSTDTAKLIGQSTARSLTPVSFELGGKSPYIVCADADLDAAAQTAAGQYANAGQVCLAGTRLLVDASIADDFQKRFRAAAAHMTVGDPREKSTRVGPLITPEHYKRVEGFVDRALKSGVKPLWGGKRSSAGQLYFEPTLLDGARQDMEIVQREVFGPVLTWQTFRDEDELIELANGTHYGLAAMVFSKNEERAMRIASRVTAGTVWVNCFFVRELAAPFGGSRDSGIGREGGNWSFDFYCDVKNIAVLKKSFARRRRITNN